MLKHSFRVFPVQWCWFHFFQVVVCDNLPCLKDLHQFQISFRTWLKFVQTFDLKFHSKFLRFWHCSNLDCFSRFTILFQKFWLTFLTIKNSLFNFLLAVKRRSTLKSLEIWLNNPWIYLPTTTPHPLQIFNMINYIFLLHSINGIRK